MLHTVARLHYEGDLSQIEIARRLGISAATVSRLLRRARDEGIVRIEVRDLVAPEDVTHQLVEALGLRRAALVETTEVGLLASLAGPVGQLLREAGLRDGSVLAIGWGRAVREVIRAGLPRLPGVITVPATGGMQEPAPHFQINEFVRLAAEQIAGTPQFIHAPYLPSRALRDAFLADAAIRERLGLWERIDVALVGVGLPHAVDPVHAGAATSSEKALPHAAGDVIRHYFDAEGRLLPWDGDERLIAVSADQLRAVPLVIGVAAAPGKARAIIGAVRARLINAVVTDVATAQAILAVLHGGTASTRGP
ncbi:sugar-binding transcriptional regulator [Labrys wisconsinensis]|uniref:DNA-binding transcriptional regulator LsrR (DeoR family) n=1 Tax=Labrys wisconsinensis TaxID=425677 RepID=A0ABU0JFS9_9HYPH|nr:sugar-binding domain-containing protein [Labrys wisconsinensis]MDQ0473135.1 DNA-binding transcriptional regulator LsrR (DeoR family) [Labrys wisconsinensis]